MTSSSSKKGFTLVELIIVITLLAILATLVALNLVGHVQRSRVSACATDQRALQTAVRAYYHENDETFPCIAGTIPCDIDFDKLVPGFIHEAPASDADCSWMLDANGAVVPNNPNCPCN